MKMVPLQFLQESKNLIKIIEIPLRQKQGDKI